MNMEQAKEFAIENINKEDLGNFNLLYFDLSSEQCTEKYDLYLGDIDYVEDGNKVSSVFNVTVYKNGIVEFEWC